MDFSTLLERARNRISTEQLLRNQLLWMLLLRSILYTLLLAVNYIFRSSKFDVIVLPPNLLILLLLVVYLTTIFSAFLLLIYQGSLRRFGFIQTLIDTGFASLLVFFSGSSSSIFGSVFFFPIVAGGLILPKKGGLIAAAAATLQFGIILCLEYYGFYPAYIRDYAVLHKSASSVVLLNHFSVHGLTFFLAAILSALFARRLLKTETALSDSLKNFDQLAILYKQIFDNISTGIVTIDSEGAITSANAAVAKIIGCADPLSLVGQRLNHIFPEIELIRENHRQTTNYVNENGTTLRIGYSHMIIHGTEQSQSSSASHHKIVTLRDISEIEKLEQQVRQAEKLAAIGMMSASIAHDFRNPLAAISGCAQILAKEFSSAGTSNYANFELTSIIQREANRLSATISDFLRFSRPEHCHCNWFSLRSCLGEVLEVLKADPSWPATAEIVFDFELTTDIWADEKQMFTVFNHFIQNGLAFCPTGREKIVIQAKEIKNPAEHAAVEISFSDNGPGIQASKKEQIFEPFYTTRADGTGLGLAIVKQTIEEHHGTVIAANSVGGGAVFTVSLPLP